MNHTGMESLRSSGNIVGRRVGILGGGQLARMLIEAAHRLGLHPVVLAGGNSDPAAQVCPSAVFGDPADLYGDPVVLRRFFSQVSEVAFENEFVPCEALEIAAKGTGVRFVPRLGTLFQLQDKIRQKEILTRLGIPTSPYEVLGRETKAADWAYEVLERFGGEGVFKWAQLGYDGKGTWISGKGKSDSDASRFCEDAARRGVPLYIEKKVNFRRELAMVASYSVTGEFVSYPLVISLQENGICREVIGPATALGVDSALEEKARGYAHKLAEALSLHGTFAIELFETEEGELWVNELAPRVHNTGHYSQDACVTSQFENHWRAILGLPLGATTCAPAFAMLNLLGPREELSALSAEKLLAPHAHLHWYGKKELRAGRKLGHLNGVTDSPAKVPDLLEELRVCERSWMNILLKQNLGD